MKFSLLPLAGAVLATLAGCATQVVEVRHAEHPAYLHALTDLRTARWLIAHRPGDARVSGDEDVAITRIDETINEIKRAAIDDGKNLDDHPPIDERLDRKGRLHRADELLGKAHNDIAREEDDAATRGLRDRAIHHLDDAIHATHQAIRDAENGI
jgi:hypothetical protein